MKVDFEDLSHSLALQLTGSVRHGTCFRRHLAACHAGAAPHSAVAELGVVRRLRLFPMKPASQRMIVERGGTFARTSRVSAADLLVCAAPSVLALPGGVR